MQRYLVIAALLLLAACSGNKNTHATARARPKPTPTTSTKPTPPKPATPAQDDRPVLTTNATEGNIQWVDSEMMMPVLEDAQKLHKPVFVVFHASWCAPCKVMEEEIFTLPQVYQYLNEKFINFHCDFDSPAGHRIGEILEVSKLPTVLFVNDKGVVLERYTGIISAADIEKLGNSAISKFN